MTNKPIMDIFFGLPPENNRHMYFKSFLSKIIVGLNERHALKYIYYQCWLLSLIFLSLLILMFCLSLVTNSSINLLFYRIYLPDKSFLPFYGHQISYITGIFNWLFVLPYFFIKARYNFTGDIGAGNSPEYHPYFRRKPIRKFFTFFLLCVLSIGWFNFYAMVNHFTNGLYGPNSYWAFFILSIAFMVALPVLSIICLASALSLSESR